MTLETVLIWIVVGAIAGWLGQAVVGGYAGGLLETIIIGIIGAFIGGWLFPQLNLGLPAGMVGQIIVATIGAILLLIVLRLIRRSR